MGTWGHEDMGKTPLSLSIHLPYVPSPYVPSPYVPMSLCPYALKEMPQPQVLFAFGLLNTNPLLIRLVS
jgi:hypothetical protein